MLLNWLMMIGYRAARWLERTMRKRQSYNRMVVAKVQKARQEMVQDPAMERHAVHSAAEGAWRALSGKGRNLLIHEDAPAMLGTSFVQGLGMFRNGGRTVQVCVMYRDGPRGTVTYSPDVPYEIQAEMLEFWLNRVKEKLSV